MGINIFFKVWKEFIYDVPTVDTALLAWNILKISGELEVVKVGGEEGRVEPRIEVFENFRHYERVILSPSTDLQSTRRRSCGFAHGIRNETSMG